MGMTMMILFLLCLIVGALFSDQKKSLSYKLGKNCGKAVKNFAEKE